MHPSCTPEQPMCTDRLLVVPLFPQVQRASSYPWATILVQQSSMTGRAGKAAAWEAGWVIKLRKTLGSGEPRMSLNQSVGVEQFPLVY